jgi:alanine-glyoxylate transaminase / serine-glyoxylate transaminase / serine-pyruvate transaminase
LAWRIGLMGYNSKPSSVMLVLASLEQVLKGAGVNITPGSGVAAAELAYAAA